MWEMSIVTCDRHDARVRVANSLVQNYPFLGRHDHDNTVRCGEHILYK
jgi:hypothetical protein